MTFPANFHPLLTLQPSKLLLPATTAVSGDFEFLVLQFLACLDGAFSQLLDHLDNLKLQSLKNIAYDDCLLLGSWTLEVFSENLPRDMFWRMEWKSWATELADCCCCFCCQLVDDQAACSCCCSVLCFARGMLFFLQSVPQWSWYYLVSSGIRHHECSSACKALQ